MNCQWDPQTAIKASEDIPRAAPAVGCACNREITLHELCKVFKKQKRKICEQYLPHTNATFRNYGMSTCLRKAHFLAQIGHESGELQYTAEILGKKKEADVYDGYKGRGLIQITWGKNYKAYGKAIQHDFTGDHRVELEEPRWATDSAGWFWTGGSGRDLNALADRNDLLAITARVNGGFNGFEDRKSHLVAAFNVLKITGCNTAGVGGQQFLPFRQSEIYNSLIHAFAWGCWNDVKSGKKGVSPSAEERKAGYARFLELNEERTKAHRKMSAHFGFSPEKMVLLATEGRK